jgi:hypothetical protein
MINLSQDGFIALDLAATPEIKKMLVGKKAIRSCAGDVSIISAVLLFPFLPRCRRDIPHRCV